MNSYEEQWAELEEVFDQEMWALIDRLIERGLNSDQATQVLHGFSTLTFDGISFTILYEDYQSADDKELFKKDMSEYINIYDVEV